MKAAWLMMKYCAWRAGLAVQQMKDRFPGCEGAMNAVNNNTVLVSAGLSCTHLSAPPIGASPSTFSLAYEDGDPASDAYVLVGTSETKLHNELTLAAGEWGFALISNPGPLPIVVTDAGLNTIGPVPPGTTSAPCSVLLPVQNGFSFYASVATGTQLVGVTTIKAVTNA